MEINKAVFDVDGNNIHITMPFAKINKETRTVSGFATLDNVDTQGDLVTAEASQKAFSEWRGNVREMHDKHSAVGKAVDIREEEFYDAASDTMHKGMFVTVRISKGAQNTWEKVLDGTLTGFSIGGSVRKAATEFSKATGSAIRKVTDYMLTELSLVDNPANQLANIVSFQKAADGSLEMTGELSKMAIENIFYCAADELAVTTAEETYKCSSCGSAMTEIGWVESVDDKTEVVKAAIEKFVNPQFANGQNVGYNITNGAISASTITTGSTGGFVVPNGYTITINGTNPEQIAESVAKALAVKGGANVSKDTIEKSEGATEETAESVNEGQAVEGGPAATNAENTETPAPETAAEVSEVDEPDLEKMFSDLRETLTTAITSAKTDTEKAITDAREGFEKAVSDVTGKVSELETKFSEISTAVDSLKETVGAVEKRVDGVESDTAIKKSNDLGGSEDEKLEKSVWTGAFLGVNDI